MEDIKTANGSTYNYSKTFKRYLKSRSTRSLRAIHRTKRLDAGFFWLEFYPLVRDIFLTKHQQFTEKDFEVMMQLHANQPFSIDDIYDSTVKGKPWAEDWTKKTSLGIRAAKGFLAKTLATGAIRVFKKNGRYNKKLYEFSPEMSSEFRRMYEYILCISKIRIYDTDFVPSSIRQSRSHLKKMLKQNAYKEKFETDLKSEIQTNNKEFAFKLHQVRIESKKM